MFNFSNIVYIERRKYTYSLDEENNKLILIPHSKEINEFSIVKELMGKWIYLKGDELVNFSALLGYGHVHIGNMCFDII